MQMMLQELLKFVWEFAPHAMPPLEGRRIAMRLAEGVVLQRIFHPWSRFSRLLLGKLESEIVIDKFFSLWYSK